VLNSQEVPGVFGGGESLFVSCKACRHSDFQTVNSVQLFPDRRSHERRSLPMGRRSYERRTSASRSKASTEADPFQTSEALREEAQELRSLLAGLVGESKVLTEKIRRRRKAAESRRSSSNSSKDDE
jgi:hypothetical protein